jgi:uncharacterized RDD family membrane protein YckC
MADQIAFCNQCGGQNAVGATFCSKCGGSLGGIAQTIAAAPARSGAASTRYGGFWIRFVAAIIDAILVQVVVVPFGALLGGMIGVAGVAARMPGEGTRLVSVIVGTVLGLLGSWIYEAAMESSSLQATLGKMIFGMKVTDLNGNRISFARATGRHFAKYLSSMILFVGYIMAGFTERKQALHDMIAGTLVIRRQ